ncbi:putative glucuronosyltransferase PGSIP8 [Wolffia australiana]
MATAAVAAALLVLMLTAAAATAAERRKHAYAAMMYMGTPRDYEFYVATRVMLRSIAKLNADADLLVIASHDVPLQWQRTMKVEDGIKVVTVKNMRNPYEGQGNFDPRFKLTLNKLYAWSLIEYERVVMIDSDNIFLQRADELFQCGQFCAVFINPCIFHTGLFVLQPSMDVFKNMLNELEVGRRNPDGADQGFLVSYFPDLLDRPLFHPPANGSKLDGTYRLPLGYQMDASYYYLKLRWNVPCGPNSVITFPSAVWLKPWYWWSWPVLPLGLAWHAQRLNTIGYGAELPMFLAQAFIYIAIMAAAKVGRPSSGKLCYGLRGEKWALRSVTAWSIIAAYTAPFFLVPRTVHPVLGWSLYLLGSAALCAVVVGLLGLPAMAVLTPWLGFCGALGVMAVPWYADGVVRALAVLAYAFCCAPVLWAAGVKVMGSLHTLAEREGHFLWLGESPQLPQSSKLY